MKCVCVKECQAKIGISGQIKMICYLQWSILLSIHSLIQLQGGNQTIQRDGLRRLAIKNLQLATNSSVIRPRPLKNKQTAFLLAAHVRFGRAIQFVVWWIGQREDD